MGRVAPVHLTSEAKGAVMRFIAFTAGSGVAAIKDTKNDRLVCTFFRDKKRPEATEAMRDVCLHALNGVVEKAAATPKEQLHV